MRALIDLHNEKAEIGQRIDVKSLENILPAENTLALIVANQKAAAIPMQWGFQTGGSLVINARSETVRERAMFKQLCDQQRCALPATGYYEWRDGDHLRHLITRSDTPLFYLAGLYRFDEKGAMHFVVLTRASYGPHSKIHSRMPCILYSREESRRWISGAMPVEELYSAEPDGLSIEVQGLDQLMMEFDD